MNFAAIKHAAAADGLAIFGAFHPATGDKAPEGVQTLILLGPLEPGYWQRLKSSPEWGGPDPVDAWSLRVISALAAQCGADAYFPFGGPPWHAFYSWAMASGSAWASPVGLLVQAEAGLMVSYRGALGFRQHIALPVQPEAPPCASCATQPCRTACPAEALTPTGYDVPKCHAFLDTSRGADCLSAGCEARRACPVSKSHGRLAEQSAHHMRHFHKEPS